MFNAGGGGMIGDWIKSAADDTKRDQLTLYNMYDANRRENTRHSEWNAVMNFETDKYYNNAFNRVADLQHAGLNPMLAVSGGIGSSPSGSASSSAPASGGQIGGSHGSAASFAASSAAAAQASLADAQREKLIAEKNEIVARTPSHAVSMDKMRQDILTSMEQAKSFQAHATKEYASAAELTSRIAVQKESITQIRATVQNLISMADKARAETGEIQQRVKANLPELTRALGDLDVAIKKMSLPGHENDRNAQESAAGAVGAAIRSIMPFRDLFK